MIRRQLPHDLELEQVRVEEFYYDGVRRISETLTTPLFSSGGGPVGGGGGSGSQTYTDREYVWAPPPSGYVDECIAQIDRGNTVRYVIQDASYDVVAIVAPQTQSAPSKVIGQYTWDPYGQVLTAEYSGLSASYNKLGHHGLFADRLDANYTQPTLMAGFLSTTHLPARIVYSVRNRTYDPSTQRWLQRDPNATGQVVLGSMASGGQWMSGAVSAIELSTLYDDGMSLYGYARNGPPTTHDPSGLFGFISALGTGIEMADLAADMMDGAMTGVVHGLALVMMVDEYNAYVDTGMEWASDWSQPDDAYARSSSWAIASAYWAADGEESAAITDENALLVAAIAGEEHDHHGFPKEFKDDFRRINIDVDNPQYRKNLKTKYHLQILHGKNRVRKGGAYNAFWEEFFDGEHGPVTKANALDKLKKIKKNGWRIPKGWR